MKSEPTVTYIKESVVGPKFKKTIRNLLQSCTSFMLSNGMGPELTLQLELKVHKLNIQWRLNYQTLDYRNHLTVDSSNS